MKVSILCALVVTVVAFGPAGCGQDESLSSACKSMVNCGQFTTTSDCKATMGALVLSSPCIKAIAGASCTDHAANPPSYWAVCWDQCSVEGQHCAGDTIQMCTDGWELIGDCEGVCNLNNRSYLGVCADEYLGQPSDNGLDVCWCSE